MSKYNEIYSRPAIMNMVEENGKLWMALLNRNGICELDMVTRQAKICKVFDGEPLSGEFLYCYVAKAGNNLIFSPGLAEKIAVYNPEQDSIRYLSLKPVNYNCKEDQREAKFWNIITYGMNVYLLGYSYPAIVKIEMKTMEMTYITDWVETLEKYIAQGDTRGYFSDGYVISDGVAILPVSSMSAVVELDLKADYTMIRKLDIPVDGIGSLSSTDGNTIWLTGRGHGANQVFCWNRQNGTIESILLTDEKDNVTDPFYAPICTESQIFFMPISATSSYEVNPDGEIIKRSEEMGIHSDGTRVALWSGCVTMAPKLGKNCLIYLTGEDLKWHKYNVMTGEHFSYNVYIEEGVLETERLLEERYRNQEKEKLVFSELRMPLAYFLERVPEPEKQKEEKGSVRTGAEIYEQICG